MPISAGPLTVKEYAAALKALRVIANAVKKMKDANPEIVGAFSIVYTAIVEYG